LNRAPDFWDWSQQVYARTDMERLLLSLQESHGLNVNLLLWCLWTGAWFEEADEIVIRKAKDVTAEWSRSVTSPLRGVRRFLKAPPAQVAAAEIEPLRAVAKELELSAEKFEQDMLQALAVANLRLSPNLSGAAKRARRALAAYVRTTDAAKCPGFSISLLEALIELTFPSSESDGDRVG
jgi:uncharacterized protein (TIGR02444 family)